MENNNVLDFSEIPQVAMDAMNTIHRNELDIVNQLNEAIVLKNILEITPLCEKWLDHTTAHFAKENSMMEQYDFPARDCHTGEHNEALDLLTEQINTWKETGDLNVLAHYVTAVWPIWYVSHISILDVVTSAFIKQSIAAEQG